MGPRNFQRSAAQFSELGVGAEQLRLLMVPGKRVFHALAAILAHQQAPLRIVDQLQDLLGEIRWIVGLGVERGALRRDAALLDVELDDRLGQRHVLHDLVHGGDVVHRRDAVGIYADIGRGQHGEELGVVDPAGESDVIRHLHRLGEPLHGLKLWPAAGHHELNVATAPDIDGVADRREQQIDTFRPADHADITDQELDALCAKPDRGQAF